MMPDCQYKKCKRVASTKLGVIKEYVCPYLCEKHFKKILKILNIKYKADGDYR